MVAKIVGYCNDLMMILQYNENLGGSSLMNDPAAEALKDGPLLVPGPLKLIDANNKETVIERKWVALCRCGQSSNKPLCDGTHSKAGFKAPEANLFKP